MNLHSSMSKRGRWIALIALGLLVAAGRQPSAQTGYYTLLDIVDPQLLGVPALDMNDNGVVAGGGVGNGTGFIWTQAGGGQPIPIYATQVAPSSRMRINNNGVVAGIGCGGGSVCQAEIWRADFGEVPLGYFPNGGGQSTSYASAINDQGQVVGSACCIPNVGWAGFIWSSATGLQELPTDGLPNDINAIGQIVGGVYCNGLDSTWVWSATGGPSTIPLLPNSTCQQGLKINDSGVVVGRTFLAPDNHGGMFRWSSQTGTEDLNALGAPPGSVTAIDINNAGDIVVSLNPPTGGEASYLYSNGVWTDINDLVPLGSRRLQGVTAINNRGWIVGSNFLLIPPAKKTPNITWGNPGQIIYGEALGVTQLDALADVTGTFHYTPDAGTLLNAGPTQPLSVLFKPDDYLLYTPATATVSIDVLRAGTTTTITATPSTISSLQQVTVNATVNSLFPGGVVKGSVQVLDGTALIGTASITNNSATFVVNSFSSGVHSLSAVYVPDPNHNSSSSLSTTVTVNVLPVLTYSYVIPVTDIARPGQPATVNVFVNTLTGSPVPNGSVTLFDGFPNSVPLASAPVIGGVATIVAAYPDRHNGTPAELTASYGGSPPFQPSSSGWAIETVYKGHASVTPSALSLTSSATQVPLGRPITVTATLNHVIPHPVGEVVLFTIDDRQNTRSVLMGNTSASITISSLSRGTHIIWATYFGDNQYSAGNGPPLIVVVQ